MVQVNPKLKTLSIPKENELLHPDVQQTIADSNLVDIDPRIVIFDDERWLAKVLSDISKQDVGNWMLFGPQPFSERIGLCWADFIPGEESNVQAAKPLPLEAGAEAVAIFPSERKPIYKFSIANRKEYFRILSEEIRAIDSQLPIVAVAEDSLGLCLIEMQQLDFALPHFRESIRIRESYPELIAQSLQTRVFIADCFQKLGNQDEAKLAVPS